MSDKLNEAIKKDRFIGSNIDINQDVLSKIFEKAICDYYKDSSFTVEVRDVNQGSYSSDLLVNVHYPNDIDWFITY